MTVTFADLQNEDNPQNGVHFDSPRRIRQLIADLASSKLPVACQFTHDDGGSLVVGISSALGFVQYTGSDAMPPYLMATAPSALVDRQDMEFAVGDTMTPIAGKFLIPMELVIKAVEYFFVGGQRTDALTWVEFE